MDNPAEAERYGNLGKEILDLYASEKIASEWIDLVKLVGNKNEEY